jgi:hypothetical protein
MAAGQITFSIDTSGVDAQLKEKTTEVITALGNRMTAVDLMLQSKIVDGKLSGNPIKHRTGKLAGSIRVIPTETTGDAITGGVLGGGGAAPYAEGLEDGNPPHVIVPSTKQALMFQIDGKTIFAKRVNHPGNPPFLFMKGTLAENEAIIRAEFQSVPGEVLGA